MLSSVCILTYVYKSRQRIEGLTETLLLLRNYGCGDH